MTQTPKNKILLTGATGFVGGHVIRQLKKDFTLYAISTKATAIDHVYKTYNWSEISTIEETFDAVIHIAGLAHDTQNKSDESAYFDVNVGLTEKLLGRLLHWNTSTFVYLSSVKAVVDSTSDKVLDESIISRAKDVYGRSKLNAEKVILDSNTDTNRIIFRPVMIYGHGQKGNLNTLEKLINKRFWFPFKNWENRRSLLAINNLTTIIRSVLIKPIDSGVYFIADDNAVSTVDILKSIGIGTNQKVKLIGFPNTLIKLGLRVLPKKFKSFANKIFGSLQVDNSKLKHALGITDMPFKTETELPATFLSQPPNMPKL